MRVLFQPRIQNFLGTAGGGLKRQVLKTMEFLVKAGVQVTISLRHNDNLNDYDVVHLFSPDTYFQAINTRKYNTPVVLSTVYWLDRYQPLRLKSKIKSGVMLPYRIMKAALSSYFQEQSSYEIFRQQVADLTINAIDQHKTVFESAAIWLPNGVEEYRKIVKNLQMEKEHRIVPNAIDKNLLTIDETPVPLPNGDYALCVAAITPRKNQLQLIRIAKELGINLVLVGSCRSEVSGYFEQCQQQGRGNTLFLGELSDGQLAYVYRRAKIHVLASIYETPGLSSLEAALFGCPIVSTSIGAVYEYFGEDAFYCDPYDECSIKKAMMCAWEGGRSEALQQRILSKYTWQTVADMTIEAYETLLNKRKD